VPVRHDDARPGGEVAHRTHPWVTDGDATTASTAYADPGSGTGSLLAALPTPPADAFEEPFVDEDLVALRSHVTRLAVRAGVEARRSSELALAVHELATNSLRHGGGGGVLRAWQEPGAFVCEVQDAGLIDQPLVGRALPRPGQTGGHGLWLVNQICDLVQLRSSPDGSVVRVHMAAA
jgi:anti-sigma regulatory factor (Ser/Thr protein kinase)